MNTVVQNFPRETGNSLKNPGIEDAENSDQIKDSGYEFGLTPKISDTP